MLRKSKKLFSSIVCLLLAVTMLFTSNIEYAFAGFTGGVAPVTVTSSSRPRGTNITPGAVTSKLVGRSLVGAGWVFGIASYNTATEHGYNALGVSELADAYQNGVLVYNDISFSGCAKGHSTISSEISGHNLHVGSNALVSSGYYFEDLEFKLQGYSTGKSTGGVGFFNEKVLNAGFKLSNVTSSNSLMACVPFTQRVDNNSNTKLQVSKDIGTRVALSAVYPIDVSDQNAYALKLSRLEYKHVSGYPKLVISCSCNSSNNCGSSSCGTYTFNCTCDGTSSHKCTRCTYDSDDKWTGCNCTSSNYCSSCRKLVFSNSSCKCDEGTYSDITSLSASGYTSCSKCSFKWSDQESLTARYETFNGKVSAMYDKLSAWKGKDYSDSGLNGIPADTLNMTNGAVNNVSVTVREFSDDDIGWCSVADDLLSDANTVTKTYSAEDYVLKEDFPVLSGKKSKKYTNASNPIGSGISDDDYYEDLGDIVNKLNAVGCVITVNSDVKSKDGKNKGANAKDDAKADALTKLKGNDLYKSISNFCDSDGYIDSSVIYDPSKGCRYAYYINYTRNANTAPIGIAKTLSDGSNTSPSLQYNAYSTGGQVSVHGGNKSSFDNGLYNNASDYVINSSNASIIKNWYTGSVGATTNEVTGMDEFGNLVSDTNSTFKTMINNTDLKIDASTSATNVSNTIGKDIDGFNSLWSVTDGKANKDFDLNNAEYRGKLYDQLVTLKGSSFRDSSGNEITRDNFINNEVSGKDEDWIYVIVAVPVVLIENYVSGVTAEDETALGSDRGQTVVAVYPSCEFLRYDGSLNNDNKVSVGSILLGQETYAAGGYINCFAGMSGVYSVGHRQYLSKQNGGASWDVVIASGITGKIDGGSYSTTDSVTGNKSDISYGSVKKVFKDSNMDLIPDDNTPVEPDFKGFIVYGANLDMSVRLASNVTAYLDSTSFDASSDKANVKKYTDVDFSNIGVRNYTLNEDEKDNKVALDTTPYDVSLAFSYTTKGLRYWYSSQELNPVKKLYRTALEKDIATSEVVGISTSADKKANEYVDYDILNETSQFYIKSGETNNKFSIYKKGDTSGSYLHNVIENTKSNTKIKYDGQNIGGDVSFGKLYTTSVVYDTADSSATLSGALYNRVDKLANWSSKGFVSYTDLKSNINRYADRNRDGYDSLKTRAMVLGARLLVNGLEYVDPIDNNNVNLSYPGRFVLSGSEDDGYNAVGNGQYATVAVQVYEKRKTNKSHLKVIDIEVDDEGNFKTASDTGNIINSRDDYYYDEESYLDWTNPESGITLLTNRTDAEIAIKSGDAQFINYMAVPNNSTYGYKENGSSCLKGSDITASNYKIPQLQEKLGVANGDYKLRSTSETGVNIGTTPKNDGYTVYVFRYYVKYQDGTTGEVDGSITADSSLYLEDYELSHVYNNVYNRKDATASNISDYYIRTSYAYKDIPSTSKTNHSWISGYSTNGYRNITVSKDYRKVVADFTRYIWQNKLTSSACNSIIGKYYTNGVDTDSSHNSTFYSSNGYNFSTIMGSNSNTDIVGITNAFDWSYPQNSALAIPFSTTLTRNSNAKLGYSVMLTRDMAGDKVVISGLTDSVARADAKDKDGHSIETSYNDGMRKAFIDYLEASGVIKDGKDVNDIPQNNDAITASKVGVDNTTATTSTNHRSTSVTNTQSIRYGSDVTSETDTASQDTSTSNQYYSIKDRISLTGGWQLNADNYKKAEIFGDKVDAFTGESTLITEGLYGKLNGVGQYHVLRHNTESDFSDLRTLMIRKDRDGNRVHGFIGNIDVYQYFYKYYVGARDVGENTECVLGGIARPVGLENYLFDAKDYLSTYSGTDSKIGKLPVYTGGTSDNVGAYTQAYIKTHNVLVGYYPEVKMSMQIPDLETVNAPNGVDGETRTQIKTVSCTEGDKLLGIYTDTIWTMGEYIRKTKLSSIYFAGIKSSGGSDTSNKLYSDNSVSNANGSVFGNTIPSLYAGADVSLVVEPKFSVWTYGYSLDLINKDYDNFNNIVSLEGQRAGSEFNYTYKNVINDGVDIYKKWGNTTSSSSRDKLVSDFEDFTKAFGMSVDADITLKSVNTTNYNSGIISSDTSTGAEVYQNFSTSVGKLVSDSVNSGEHELVYTIEIAHGKLVENTSTVGGNSFNAMLKQMAVDYYGIVDGADGTLATQRVTDEQLQAMKKMFMDSGIVKTILDSIESDTDADNTSSLVGHKILGISNEASWNNINAEHWYDERVKTFVIRRFFQKSALDSITLDDKLDYNMGVSSNGVNDNVQNSYDKKTYCWFLNLYMDSKLIDRNKLVNQTIADYFTQGTVYGSNDVSNTNWYSSTRDDNTNSYKAGTGLINNLYLPGGDFNIVSDTVAN